MAKAEPQKSKVVRYQEQSLNIGDVYGPEGGPKYRYLGVGGDGTVKVRFLPEEVRTAPDAVDLTVSEENDGMNLYLMQEEAVLVRALTELLHNMRLAVKPENRSKGDGLDGTHDVSYWLERVSQSLNKAGITFGADKGPLTSTYWQLSDLVRDYAKQCGNQK